LGRGYLGPAELACNCTVYIEIRRIRVAVCMNMWGPDSAEAREIHLTISFGKMALRGGGGFCGSLALQCKYGRCGVLNMRDLGEDGFEGRGGGGLELHVVGQPLGSRPHRLRRGAQVLEDEAQLLYVGHPRHPRLPQQQLCSSVPMHDTGCRVWKVKLKRERESFTSKYPHFLCGDTPTTMG